MQKAKYQFKVKIYNLKVILPYVLAQTITIRSQTMLMTLNEYKVQLHKIILSHLKYEEDRNKIFIDKKNDIQIF